MKDTVYTTMPPTAEHGRKKITQERSRALVAIIVGSGNKSTRLATLDRPPLIEVARLLAEK